VEGLRSTAYYTRRRRSSLCPSKTSLSRTRIRLAASRHCYRRPNTRTWLVSLDVRPYPGDLTLPQRSNSRSSLELHLTSKSVRGTNAKESRVKVSLHSFMYSLFTDFDFAADLGTFFKSPPGASSRCMFAGIIAHLTLVL